MSTQQQSAPTRGALVIKRAVELMRAGQARGWSDALSQAARQVK